LSVNVLAADPVPGNCYSYTAANPEWEDISDGMSFRRVAGNTDSSAVWAISDKRFSSS